MNNIIERLETITKLEESKENLYNNLSIGDNLIVIKKYNETLIPLEVGIKCKVIDIYKDFMSLEFEKYINGHSAHSMGKDGYCWNFNKIEIENYFKKVK